MEDERIVQLFNSRSQSAITELQKKYGRLCSSVTRNILQSDEDAEECVNDTLLRVWNSIPPQSPENLMAYVSRIARNTALDRYRANHRKKRCSCEVALDELEDCLPAPSGNESEDAEIKRVINGFISQLDAETQVLFIRRYIHMEPVSSLAERFGLSENSISVKLFRARKKLKRQLESEGINL